MNYCKEGKSDYLFVNSKGELVFISGAGNEYVIKGIRLEQSHKGWFFDFYDVYFIIQ